MIDTNTFNAATATAAAAQTTFNAWHVVAALAAGTLVHAYHVIVNGGGVKRLWSNFWNGPATNQSIKNTGGGGNATAAAAEPTAVPAQSAK